MNNSIALVTLQDFIHVKLDELKEDFDHVKYLSHTSVHVRNRIIEERIRFKDSDPFQLGHEIGVHEFPKHVKSYEANATEVKIRVIKGNSLAAVTKIFYFLWEDIK